MAKIRANGYTRQFRGRAGDHVFRRNRDGTMTVMIRPDFSHVVPTAAQLEVHENLRKAARFAQRVLANPATRARYELIAAEVHRSPFNLGVRDWFHQPAVDEIRLTRYHGQAADVIDIVASDDIGLTEVRVVIKNSATNAILEEGVAAPNGPDWAYTATTTLPASTPVTIEVTAKDGTEHQDTNTRNYP
jgi:hypothetical protein